MRNQSFCHLVAMIAALSSVTVTETQAQPVASPTTVLFQNVRVFNAGNLSTPTNVLVRGNKIEKLTVSPIPVDRGANTLLIEGNGRTLMPGLIDAHAHIMMAIVPQSVAMTADIGYLTLKGAQAGNEMILRGFTTIRDLGGPAFSLKRAIDEGVVPGPRIYPSGAFISQTGGHGDFRMPYEIPRTIGDPLSHMEKMGAGAIADSPDEVRLRAREQLMMGATQLKLMAGGGVASAYDPLDVAQYTEPEFRAAVEAAANWGTYVTVHAYTPVAIKTAIAGGVKCIEHGQLADDATAKLMAEKGIWWSLQPFLNDEDAIPFPEGSSSRKKQLEMISGTDTAYKLAKKYKIKDSLGHRHTLRCEARL